MTSAQENILRQYFLAILPFCNQQKLAALLVRLGYQVENIDAELCVQAYKECGKDFYQPFGKIALVAIDSPKYQAYLRAAQKSTNVAYNMTPISKALTEENKMKVFETTMDTISSLFNKGTDVFSKTGKQDSQARLISAQAELLKAQNQTTDTESKSTQSWLIPVICGVVALVVVLVIVVVLSKKK